MMSKAQRAVVRTDAVRYTRETTGVSKYQAQGPASTGLLG